MLGGKGPDAGRGHAIQICSERLGILGALLWAEGLGSGAIKKGFVEPRSHAAFRRVDLIYANYQIVSVSVKSDVTYQ